MRKNLAIYHDDERYLERLYHFLKGATGFPLSIYAFTQITKLEEFAQKEMMNYLLVPEEAKCDISAQKIIRISKERKQGFVYMYSPGDEIKREVLRLLDLEEKDLKDYSVSGTSFIGVFSPVSRCMKTTFSKILGQMLARKKKTLYLNFEAFAGMSVSQSVSGRGNLSDILYYFNNLRSEFPRKFHECIESVNGLDCISPAYYFIDLSYVKADRWKEFLNAIDELGEYDYVIMDLSDYLDGILDVFLPACDVVYTMTASDRAAQNKIFQYEEILRYYNHTDVLEKTRKFSLPVIKNLPDSMDRLVYTDLAEMIRRETDKEFDWDDKRK